MSVSDFPEMDSLCNEVLTAMEWSELKLLDWGFVDVRSPLEDMLPQLLEELSGRGQLLWDEAQQFAVNVEDILTNLRERRLIFPSTQSDLYRSRFAETIRLLTLLRQRFSKDDWQTGSRLVSDAKIYLAKRKYPKRDISKNEFLQELRIYGASPLYMEAIEALLKQNNSSLMLARFQKEAILQQYRILHPQKGMPSHSDYGIVIGAGTGAGKTKAFYIPAMAEIAATMTAEHYVRALAIYPRVELLKDQFLEAFQEARKLDELLIEKKPRTISIGAYYADTPYSAKTLLDDLEKGGKGGIRRNTDGWEIPFFSCPNHDDKRITHPLIWYKEDIKKEIKTIAEKRMYGTYARLRCPDCYFQTQAHQIALTREQMIHTLPDILFTTTEMLNRRLSHAGEHHLFGIDANTPPKMLLLDEIHTYEGLQGTQVAYLLRRWRHARRQQRYVPLCCVGLSATLSNAESFFSRLTGVIPSLVRYVHPTAQDMEEEGIEYNVVLKGDPVSGASLLSTSVQVVMLLGRLLDKSFDTPSHGAYGQKLFAFTDKLDVINRWFHIEEDVEKKLLSQYRIIPTEDTSDIRRKKQEAGQDWQICNLIGHPLQTRLKINLTSSQHRGVDASANVIIATSTLEVGFNDPAVGAVVQHKAPRSLASFLQRKGRAGRSRSMRPWMVVVASAYGRDRWAFQHAENLFEPTLNDIDLPLDNYYVRKMQATFALMDWLSFKLKQESDCSFINLWSVLSSHDKGQSYSSELLQKQRYATRQKLAEVLDGTLRDDFALYLQQSLGLEPRTIQSLLWDEPRSLLFEVLPTVIRQLDTNWQSLKENKAVPWTDTIASQPMPDFVTPNLFSDLQSPEITLHLPAIPSQTSGYKRKPTPPVERKDEALPLQQCLTEFAPGNVSKRYADSRVMQDAHWLEIPEDDYSKGEMLQLSKLKVEYDTASFPFIIDGKEYRLFRPRAYTLSQLPASVNSTSVSHMFWHSHFASKKLASVEDGSLFTEIIFPRRSQWNKFFTGIRSYTHANGSWVEIARLGTGVQIDTRYTNGKTQRLWLQFEEQKQPAGLGFINYVDALEFQFQPLDVASFTSSHAWPELYRSLCQTFFLYKLQNDPRIQQAKLSLFEIEWLWQLELSMLVATAVATKSSLEETASYVRTYRTSSQSNSRASLADRTMRVIFQAQQVDDLDEDKVGRLHNKLKQLLAEEAIQQTLDEAQQVLWNWDDPQLQEWLQQCYTSSLGNTLFASLTQLVPDIDPDDLILDIVGNSIWISEITPGGIGLVSKIADALATKPYEFELQMLDILQYCERQELATQLQMVAKLLGQEDRDLLFTFESIRQETDLPNQNRTLHQLKNILEARGIPATRELVVSLNAKFLRPNSSQDSDILLTTLVEFWQSEEQRLGCNIDLRVIAVAALRDETIKRQVGVVLERIGDASDVKENQIFNLLQSLLWLSCSDSCPDCIEHLYKYQDFVKPSRAILLALLELAVEQVTFGMDDWQEHLRQTLITQYVVQVSCLQDELEACKQFILDMLVEPVEVGFQFFYPTIERISRTGLSWVIELRIREFANV